MDTTATVQDPPEFVPPARTTRADDGAEITVRANQSRAHISVDAAASTVYLGVCLTRAQLIAHRDACNAVLAASESEAVAA